MPMDGRPLLSLSPSAASGGAFPLLPTDLRRLLALPDRSSPPALASASSPSVSSPGTIASAVEASASDLDEEHSFHAQLERLGGVLGLARALRVDLERGLDAGDSDGDLQYRADWFGANYVAPPPPRRLLRLIAEAAFMDTTNLILVIDGAVAVALGMAVGSTPSTDWMEGTCVLIAVLAIALVTAVGDFQKERQFRALNAVNENELVRVVRFGVSQESEKVELSGQDVSQGDDKDSRVRKWSIVVGDIIRLEPGDVVPADGLAFHTQELKVDEITLTDEAEVVRKGDALQSTSLEAFPVDEDLLPVQLFSALINGVGAEEANDDEQGAEEFPKSSSSIQDGSHYSLDVAETAAARKFPAEELKPAIAKKKKPTRPERTPLAQKIQSMNLWLGKMGVVVASTIFIVLCVRISVETFAQEPRQSWKAEYLSDYLSYFILGTTILVVAIPEGLPLAVAIALALAVRRMLRGRSLVRHLVACETVGNATTLLSDKTGTLTANRVSVARIWLAPEGEGEFVSVDAAVGDSRADFDSVELATTAMSADVKHTLCEGVALYTTAECCP